MDPKARARAKETAAKQGWREPDALDDSQAARLRDALAHVGLYPTQEWVKDDLSEYLDALRWYELQDILSALDETDLVVIHAAARLLAVVPRDPSIFDVALCYSAMAIATGGIDPRQLGMDIDALGVADTCDALRQHALNNMDDSQRAELEAFLAIDDKALAEGETEESPERDHAKMVTTTTLAGARSGPGVSPP
jgi:hypothetical protein